MPVPVRFPTLAAAVLVTCVACAAGGSGDERGGSTYAEPAVTAAFDARSYAPGDVARLTIRNGGTVRLQILHAGLEARRARSNDTMAGKAVTPVRRVEGGHVSLTIGDWPSGLYFAELHQGKLVGYAPFVVRPRHLGEHRILEVVPTNTWAAYNFRDGATWYADSSVHTVRLDRPFLDRGVPPHYRQYDSGFIHWLAQDGPAVDFVSDDDLEAVTSGDELARAYDLIVFSGHEEYVTPHTYDIVTRYRDLGGNLMFLAANNFFYRVTRTGQVLHGRRRWRDVGRPEAALIGAQYVDWNHARYPNRPYTVVGAQHAPWLFAPARLKNGETFGNYGIEIDGVTKDSPPGTQVLAQIPDAFGKGKTAEMTYYETKAGAKVFDAGVMNFGGTSLEPPVRALVSALFTRLARP